MRQFAALFQKELNSYFKSYFAYMIFFVYLFVSLGTAFYFGAYLSAHDEAMYPLFYAQPIVLLVLLPALTMKIWSEEYRSGTAEFLLTLPLNPYVPVVAKFLAAFVLCVIMSLFFLPFIFYTAQWLYLDWGNIASAFMGLWLLMAFLCALGCLISALSKNVVVAYLFSVLVMSLWIVLPSSGLYEIYNNFLFGEVGLPDFAYFILLTFTFLLINGLVPEFQRSVQKLKTIKFAGFTFLLVTAIMVFNVVLQYLVTYKFDLTATRFYTLSAETQKIVERVYKPLTVEVYVAKNYIARNNEYFHYYQRVRRFLQKYEDLSEGMIRIHVTQVEPFSPLEDDILDNGLFFELSKDGSKEYFGALVRDENKNGVIIKQFLPARKMFLEKDINKALIRLTRSAVYKNIGVSFDVTQNLDQFEGFLLNLESDYNVMNVSSDIFEISDSLDMLILVNPKQLPKTFLYAVDQFVMRGGKLLVFADFLTQWQPDLTNMANVDILPLLEQYYFVWNDRLANKVTLNPTFAVEDKNVSIYKGISFKFSNSGMKITPFLKENDNYVGALLTGALPSMFGMSPYIDLEKNAVIAPHNAVSVGDANVALIGDVDFIEDDMWIDERSPDRNPYSVIAKKDNINALRRFIDTMLGNEIFNRQPIHSYRNPRDIASLLDEEVYQPYVATLAEIEQKMQQLRSDLYETNGKDNDKMAAMLRVGSAGQEIAHLEKKRENAVYQIKQSYKRKVQIMIGLQVLLLPLFFTLFLALLMKLRERLYNRKMRRLGYEK